MSMQSQLSHVNGKYLNYHCDMIAIVLFVLDVVIIARKQNKNETNLVIIAIVVIERNKKNRSLLQVVIERGRTASLPVQ